MVIFLGVISKERSFSGSVTQRLSNLSDRTPHRTFLFVFVHFVPVFFYFFYFSGSNFALDPTKNYNKKTKTKKEWKSVVTTYFKPIMKYYLNAILYKKESCND